jgi:N-acetylneuraminic acid mutarotase
MLRGEMRTRTLGATLVAVLAVTPAVAGASSAGATWNRLAAAPIAPNAGTVAVWTGNEMLVFGSSVKRAPDGAVLGRVDVAAAYNPASDAWRALEPPNSAASFPLNAAWTGNEVLVWGQGTHEALNPRTNRWRTYPSSPLLSVHDAHGLVAWTGRDLLGWGGGCCGDAFSDGVAYRPATNRWRALARSPLAGSQHPIGAWTGSELVVLVGNLDPDGKPWPRRLARAAAYNPATNTWRRLAAPPVSITAATATWNGRELLVVGAGRGRLALAFDPKRNRWRRLALMPGTRSRGLAVWTGSRLLLWGGWSSSMLPRTALAYSPRTNRWTITAAAPVSGRTEPSGVWTGRKLIVFGGHRPVRSEGEKYFADGAALTLAG